jgi:hypothetical protein
MFGLCCLIILSTGYYTPLYALTQTQMDTNQADNANVEASQTDVGNVDVGNMDVGDTDVGEMDGGDTQAEVREKMMEREKGSR